MLIDLDRLTEIVTRQCEIVRRLDDYGGANADLAKSLHVNLSRSLKLIQAVMETRRPFIEKWAITEAEIAHRRDRNVARSLQLIQRSECSVELAHALRDVSKGRRLLTLRYDDDSELRAPVSRKETCEKTPCHSGIRRPAAGGALS